MARTTRAVIAAIFLLALGAAKPCACPPPGDDAPDLARSRAFAETVVRDARRYAFDEKTLVNVTRGTTPEVAHLATGAKCRFWYGYGEVSSPFFTADHTECRTGRDWFWVGTTIDRRSGPPPKVNADHYWSYLLKRGASAEEIVREKVERLLRDSPGKGSMEGPEARVWTSPGGTRIAYVVARTVTPGGAPKGTRSMRLTRYSLAVIGDWIFTQTVNAPVHYRRNVESMADETFLKLLESIAAAGKVA